MGYDPAKIEPKWQRYWESRGTFRTPDVSEKPKYYVLDMFPYPSGAGLHVGHPEGYTATDVLARWRRMRGFNVLHPMGWDAFGLPAERAAVRDGIHPAIITRRNVDNFRRQIKRLGFSYDWEREVDTSSKDYYRWTQWIFLKLHERGLAYRAEIPVNWCPAQGTVLANEEVKDGRYVETGDPVERRLMKQWMLRITAYAERLLEDLDDLDWPEPVKAMQREWIGKSVGGEVAFRVAGGGDAKILAFTTRPDTLFGVSAVVLAPEHPLVASVTTPERRADVAAYVAAASKKSDRERSGAEEKAVSGVFTGGAALHPLTGAPLPIWVADYVLMGYGHGAVMAVPAHDERDFKFARAYGLPVTTVVRPRGGGEATPPFVDEGTACGSGAFDGLDTDACKRAVVAELERRGAGRHVVTYRLRDWLFSRQRYWGEPFPIVIGADGEAVPVPAEVLPIELPPLDDFRPAADGRPPLARATEWLRATDPRDGGPAERETNTMPQWAGSCWYYLRYLDPKNDRAAWDPAKERYWMPVDLYVGGVEHAVLHLLYARFWHKVLFDCGLVSTKEPFKKLFNQGMILAYSYQEASGRYWGPADVEESDGAWRVKATGAPVRAQIEKMSKSRLNVVNPDDVVAAYGADALRLYELFMGPLDAVKPWQMNGVEGVHRFLQRVHRLVVDDDDAPAAALADVPAEPALAKLVHRTVAKVTADLDAMSFNTAISAMMILVNELVPAAPRPKAAVETLVLLLAPFAPHLCEELWERLGHDASLAYAPWPTFDPAALVDAEIEVPVCVNGKVKERVLVPRDADQAAVEALVRASDRVRRALEGKVVKKVVYVPRKMVNLVV